MRIAKLSYTERAKYCVNHLAAKLFHLMDEKKTNLCLSADVTTSEELISLVDLIGPELCVLKTHIDIIENFTPDLTRTLTDLSSKHHFLIFEDRKFADIGHTVKNQYQKGIYKIADWADMVNAHVLPGPGIIEGLKQGGCQGLLLLAEMSSQGNLMDENYQQKTLVMAKTFPEIVIGFISQHRLEEDPKWLYLTPGIGSPSSGDDLGQQYLDPHTAIFDNGSDIVIVGRNIIKAKEPQRTAQKYRQLGWQAYLDRLI